MFGMHQQAHEVIAIGRQAIQHTDAHIIAATLLSAVHRLGVIAVVALGTRGMQSLIVLAVVSFLEQNIGTDASGFQLLVCFDLGGSDVHVQTADLTVAHLGVINGVD